MVFIVALIGLLIERFFDWGHLRYWYWFNALQANVLKRFPAKSSYLTLALTIVPFVLISGFIQYVLSGVLFGFVKLLFQLFIFLYCLGPQNLWADAFACINALVQGDTHFAADKLKSSFGITDASYSQSLHRHLLNTIFVEANRRVFAVLFWFVVLGAMGAVLYRLVSLSTDSQGQEPVPELSQNARIIQAILDWVPVRIFTFIFALGGHFVQVLSIWRKKFLSGLNSNETLLTDCGIAALSHTENLPEDGTVERAAISLLDRSFVISLVIVAIILLLS